MKHLVPLRLLLACGALAPALPATAQSWNWVALGLNRYSSDQLVYAKSTALATDPVTGNTWVGGIFRDTLHCGTTQLVSAGGTDIFVGQLDPAGHWRWAVRVGGAANDSLTALALTPAGNSVVAGTVGPGAHFGPTGFNPGSTGHSLFVAEVRDQGVPGWITLPNPANSAGVATPTVGGGLAVDAAGHVYVSGAFPDSTAEGRFGALVLADSAGVKNFAARLSAAGAWEWVTNSWSSSGNLVPVRLVADPTGRIYLAGSFLPTFGPGSGGPIGPYYSFVLALSAVTGALQWDQRVPRQISGLTTDGAGRVFIAGQMGLSGPDLFISALTASAGAMVWDRFTRHDGNGQNGVLFAQLGGLACTPSGDLTAVGSIQVVSPPCGTGSPGGGSPGGGSPPPDPWSGALRFSDSTAAWYGPGFVARFNGATGQPRWALELPAGLAAVADGGNGRLHVAGEYNYFDGMSSFGAATPVWPALQPSILVAELNENGPLTRSLSTNSAPVGATLTLTGYHYTGATQVLIGGVPASFRVINSTTITLIVPPGANGPVTVTTPLGTTTGFYFQTATMPLGVLAESATARLLLWPNPVTEAGTVRVTLPGEGSASVEVLDLLGRSLLTLPAARGTVALPLAGLPAGTYVVRVGAATARLVVQ